MENFVLKHCNCTKRCLIPALALGVASLGALLLAPGELQQHNAASRPVRPFRQAAEITGTSFSGAAYRSVVLPTCPPLQKSLQKPLKGAAATAELKKRGQYASLMSAVNQAMYGFKPSKGKEQGKGQGKGSAFGAANAQQNFAAHFDARGVRVQTTKGDHLRLQWQSVQREGETVQSIALATPTLNGEELQLRRKGATEWFRNGAEGLEQGFTLHQKPAGNGSEVRLTLAASGLRAQDQKGKAGKERINLLDDEGKTALTYSKLKVWDADGKILPARMEAKEGRILLAMRDSGARYPLTVDPLIAAQQAYLKASNTGGDDRFGTSVAVSGDTVVVGAYLEDSNASGVNGNEADNSATSSGAAYVFIRSGGTWSQQAYLKASNPEAGDNFGYSVAIDGESVVVGAIGEKSNATGVNGNEADNSANNAGAAYVFVRSGGLTGTWSQQAYLKASNTDASDIFGYSVAISGESVVVSALFEASNATGVNGNGANNSAFAAGAAYVFVRSGGLTGTWSQQAYLKASNTGGNDNFGYSVAISGDSVVVGARLENSNATGVNGNGANNSAGAAGAAYVFVRSGGLTGTWSQQAYLKASNTGANDNFGTSVAIDGESVVVGAIGEKSNAIGVNGNQADNSADSAGAAYVFVRSGGLTGTWSQQAYLKASNTEASDGFGRSVAIDGESVVVGAYAEDSGVNGNQADNSAGDAGAAYVFVRSGGLTGTWSQQAYLKASNTDAGDLFGNSVAIDGDTVVVGAYGEASNATGVNGNQNDNSAAGAGAVYVFTVKDGPPSLSINDVSISETNGGSAQAQFTLSLSPASSQSVTVSVKSAAGGSPEATSGTDYVALPATTYTFAPGQTSKTINVTILGDTLDENDEKFALTLSNAVNAPIIDATGVGTIVDNDAAPTVSVSAPNVTEGNTGDTAIMTFTIKLSAASARNISVQYQTANAATFPATAGTDYTAVPLTTVIFTAGQTTKTVNVTVNGDVLDEDNERIKLNLTNPVNATLGTISEGIIVDDDATPGLSINDVQVNEGNAGTSQMSFTITLSTATGRTVTVNAATGNGGSPAATPGSDYVALASTPLTFTPGQTSKQVSVTINGDVVVEVNEKFAVIISGAVNASIADNSGIGTILNDDAPPIAAPAEVPSGGDDEK